METHTDTAGDLADPPDAPDEDVLALRRDVAGAVLPRDVVTVRGADAVSFLQGQLSADVAALGPGASTWSLLLEPQGRVVAWVRAWRPGPRAEGLAPGAALLLDVEAGYGPAVVERLQRFLLRVDVALEVLGWELAAVRGPGVGSLPAAEGASALAAPVDWRGVPGVDLLGPSVAVPPGVRTVDPSALEALRVEAGWPAMGHELDSSVIPAEVGAWFVDSSVSFTKGCYTGQELVARIDSRGGNTPRRLRSMVVDGGGRPPVGAAVLAAGVERGACTSVARSPSLDAVVALGLLHRSVEPGERVELRWDGGAADAVVADAPVVPAASSPAGA